MLNLSISEERASAPTVWCHREPHSTGTACSSNTNFPCKEAMSAKAALLAGIFAVHM